MRYLILFVLGTVVLAQPILDKEGKTYPVLDYAIPMDGLTLGECFTTFDFLGGGWIDLYLKVPQNGTYEITLRALGEPALGENPKIELRVDGRRIADADIAPEWKLYRFPCPLSSGIHRLRIFFTNDYFNEKKGLDRNLHLDTISFKRVPESDGLEILRREFAKKYPSKKLLWVKPDPFSKRWLWVGIKKGFVSLFDTQESLFSDFSEFLKTLKINPPTLSSILFTEKSVWIGTPSGLFEYNRRLNSLELYKPRGKTLSVNSLSISGDKLEVGLAGRKLYFNLKTRRWMLEAQPHTE